MPFRVSPETIDSRVRLFIICADPQGTSGHLSRALVGKPLNPVLWQA